MANIAVNSATKEIDVGNKDAAAVVWSAMDNTNLQPIIISSHSDIVNNTDVNLGLSISSGIPAMYGKEVMPCVISPLGFHLLINVKEKKITSIC